MPNCYLTCTQSYTDGHPLVVQMLGKSDLISTKVLVRDCVYAASNRPDSRQLNSMKSVQFAVTESGEVLVESDAHKVVLPKAMTTSEFLHKVG